MKLLDISIRTLILQEIVELGYISFQNGSILEVTKPVYNLQISPMDRWTPLMKYFAEYASRHPDFEGEFFLSLYDGWREYSEPSPPEERQYIQWMTIDPSERTQFFIGKGHHGEPRFRHLLTDRPEIYPELPLKVLAFGRHRGDRNTILLPDTEFLTTQFGSYVRDVQAADESLSFHSRVSKITWHGSKHMHWGHSYLLQGGVGEVLAPYNLTTIHQRVLINIVANSDGKHSCA
jgi:hypothetical protein